MKIVDKQRFEIGVHKSGKIYWKPEWCGSNDNFHKIENGRGFLYVNTYSYFVLTTIQLFFLKWIFYIQIKPELISGPHPQKYVKYEDTHLALMDVQDGKWSDQNVKE